MVDSTKPALEPWQYIRHQNYWFRCRARHQGETRTIATVYSEDGGWAYTANRQDGTGFARGRENTPQAARIMADTWLGFYGWLLLSDPPPHDNRQALIDLVKQMTSQEVLDLSIKAGIHNPDGTLTAKYGGEDK